MHRAIIPFVTLQFINHLRESYYYKLRLEYKSTIVNNDQRTDKRTLVVVTSERWKLACTLVLPLFSHRLTKALIGTDSRSLFFFSCGRLLACYNGIDIPIVGSQLFARFLHLHLTDRLNTHSKRYLGSYRRLSRSIACTTLLVSKSVVIGRSAHSIHVVCYVGETLLYFSNINVHLQILNYERRKLRIILIVSLNRPDLYFQYKWMVFIGIKIYTNVFFQIIIEYNGKLNVTFQDQSSMKNFRRGNTKKIL